MTRLSPLIYNFKRILRFVVYKNERKKVVRELKVRKEQNILIKQLYHQDAENLIVFLIDGVNWFTGEDEISGGILSIASIYNETAKYILGKNWNVIMVTHQEAHLFSHHTQFKNDITIFRFNQLYSYFKHTKTILFHLPEYLSPQFAEQLISSLSRFSTEPTIYINILNQNIQLMPSVAVIEQLKANCKQLTQTTAHEKYSTLEVEKRFGAKLYKLSVFASPEKYAKRDFSQKDNLIAVSPDQHPLKQEILDILKYRFKNYSIVVIDKMKYEDYLLLISKAKYTITFGEGLDFYFIETVFSGGVGISIFNEDFFPANFSECPGVFSTILKLKDNILPFLEGLDNKMEYNLINSEQLRYVEKEYKYNEYLANISNYYKSTLNI